jgi:glutathione S-transferase
MTIKLYDLAGKDERRFSPHCWCTKMALAHKQLPFESVPVPFIEVPNAPGGPDAKVPTIVDGENIVTDSFAIAQYLEVTYPDRPSLFGGAGGEAGARLAKTWAVTAIITKLPSLILGDLFEYVLPEDQAYFRQSRESRFGKKLEEVQQGREDRLPAFREALHPARLIVGSQPFLGGESPLYLDYQLFGPLQWARVTSPFELLDKEDPVLAWFSRCLDLHDGLGRSMPGLWG